MAEQYNGRVVRMQLGGSQSPSSERMLRELLKEAHGIDAFSLDRDAAILIAYLGATADERDLTRVLTMSGMYPLGSTEMTAAEKGEEHAC